MKFYSYSNNNGNYTLAISLENIRSVERGEAHGGASKIRYNVVIHYCDDKNETFRWLYEEESKKLYEEIVNLLNNNSQGLV